MLRYLLFFIPLFFTCSLFEDNEPVPDEPAVYQGDELKPSQYRWQRFDTAGIASSPLIQYFFDYNEDFQLIEIFRNSGNYGKVHQVKFHYEAGDLKEISLYRVLSTLDEIFLWDTLAVEQNKWFSKEDKRDGVYKSVLVMDNRIFAIDTVRNNDIESQESFTYDGEGKLIDYENGFTSEVKFDYSEKINNPFRELSIITAYFEYLTFFNLDDLASSEYLPKCWDYYVYEGELTWTLDEKDRPTEIIISRGPGTDSYKLTIVYIN